MTWRGALPRGAAMSAAGVAAFVAAFVAACVAACQVPDTSAPRGGGIACTAIAVAGLNVTVLDSATLASVAGAKVVARSVTDSFADSTASAFSGTYALAYEHAATYTVTVSAAGYVTQSRSGIVVGKDQCHVIPQQVQVRLSKG